tara:strand:+ start:233 stop:577 length:345 start_codon:yes stop_codon:yes gene_type:complete
MKLVKKQTEHKFDMYVPEISNIVQESLYKMMQDISTQKDFVIRQKVKEIVGVEINIAEEGKRLFKRFCAVRQGNEETIYFNDGSIEGKRIVTFVKKDIPFDAEKFTLGYEETYY